jgi:hypothetical protein
MKSSIIEVIEPAASHDLTTLEIAKEELGITTDENDARLARWIREVSVYIERHCNRTLVSETVREVWHGPDYWYVVDASMAVQPLTLRRYPVVEIISFNEDDPDEPPFTADDYQLDAQRGRIWSLNSGIRTHWHWHWGSASTATVEIVYTGGYDNPNNLPPDLQAACLALLKIRNDTFGRDRFLRSQDIPGVLREEYNNPAAPGQAGLPPEICEMLRPFQEFNA